MNIFSTLGYIVSGIIIALGVNYGLAFALSTDMPIVAVQSYSMVPTFSKGDILIIQGTPPNLLEIGNIIVFSAPGQDAPIVHRIIKKNADGTFQTKGDANNGQLAFEKSIKPEQIHGKHLLTIPYIGWIKIGFIEIILPNILAITIGILIFVSGYYGIFRKKL